MPQSPMVRLAAFSIYAPWYQFFVHDGATDPQPESFYEAPEDGKAFQGSRAVGYLTTGRTICFGTCAHLNRHWAEIYLGEQAPDFKDAERVIALPLAIASGEVSISGLDDLNKPLCTVTLPEKGDYTLYLLGYSLGVDEYTAWVPGNAPEEDDEPLSDEALAARLDYEHYKLVLVPGKAARTGILQGSPQKPGAKEAP